MARLLQPPLLDPDWALFTDVDGTLLEIAPDPEAVRIPASLPNLLQALQNRHRGAFALVSGRQIGVLDDLFRPWHGAAAGLHGGERRRPDGSCVEIASEDAAAALGRVRSAADDFVARSRGVRIEDKGRTLALHYRGTPERQSEVTRFAAEAVAASGGALRLIGGKMVAELAPRDYGKGAAIAAFLAEAPFRGRVPVFLGDDATDEDGFAEIAPRGGLAIRVGPPDAASAAAYALPDVSTVLDWLTRTSR